MNGMTPPTTPGQKPQTQDDMMLEYLMEMGGLQPREQAAQRQMQQAQMLREQPGAQGMALPSAGRGDPGRFIAPSGLAQGLNIAQQGMAGYQQGMAGQAMDQNAQQKQAAMKAMIERLRGGMGGEGGMPTQLGGPNMG